MPLDPPVRPRSCDLESLAAEALRIAADAGDRLALTLRVRRGRPALVRDLALLGMVRELHRRRRRWQRLYPTASACWRTLAPEYPVTSETAAALWSSLPAPSLWEVR